jgi:hypothetical protein
MGVTGRWSTGKAVGSSNEWLACIRSSDRNSYRDDDRARRKRRVDLAVGAG